MPGKIARQAPAKLNLALSVGPPDERGMHPICSWMITIDLCDEMELTRLEPDRLSRYAILWHEEAKRRSEIDWSIRHDLAVKAHLALEKRVGRHLPLQMRLDKRIPVGGGLGGGSSDAAAMLLGANDLFDLGLSVHDLAAIGSEIGSDVPYFVHGGSAIVEGLGEKVTTLGARGSGPEFYAVLVYPEQCCPTGAVYRQFDELGSAELQETAVRDLASRGASRPPDSALFNDLLAAAVAVEPELAAVRRRVAEVAETDEQTVHLSGSGSTWFVICDSAMHAEHLAEAIESRLGLPAVAVRTWTAQPSVREAAT